MSITSGAQSSITGEIASSSVSGISVSDNESLSIGLNAAPLSTGRLNSFLGFNVARFSKTGSYNVAVGCEAASALASSYNCLLGFAAAPALGGGVGANTVVGALAGATCSTGDGNSLVGCAADVGAGDVARAVAVGAGAKAGAYGAVAIGASSSAGGRGAVAIGDGATAPGIGEVNIAGRVMGRTEASGTRFALELAADVTRLGGAICWPSASGSGSVSAAAASKPAWCAYTTANTTASSSVTSASKSDLVFLSANGVATRLTDDFRPGVLNFTGQHRCAPLEADRDELVPGALVIATGSYLDLAGREDVTDVDEALPVVALCREARDTRVFGVVSDIEPADATEDHRFQVGTVVASVPRVVGGRVSVNSAGEGALRVCGRNGNISNGELVVASSLPGVCMRQGDDVVRTSTVAKLTCDCFFDDAENEVRLVGCVYRMS